MDNLPYWRRVWRALSDGSPCITPIIAEASLNLGRKYLVQGILMYPPYTDESYNKFKEKVPLTEHPQLSKFILDASMVMDMDCCMAWALVGNFMQFEYFGQIMDLCNIISNKIDAADLLIKIWQFYAIERTYLLKIMQHVLENHKNESNRLHPQFSKFVQGVTYKQIQAGLLQQYSALIKYVLQKRAPTNIEFEEVLERNNEEIMQILALLLTSFEFRKFEVDEVLQVLQLIRENSFLTTEEHKAIAKYARKVTVRNVSDMENAVFVASLDNLWYNQDAWYSEIDKIDAIIREIFHSENAHIIMMAWSALQSTLPNEQAGAIYENHSVHYVSKALQQYVFKELYQTVSNPVFKDSFFGLTAKIGIFKLFDILCRQFGSESVFVHDGAVVLVSEFLKVKKIVYELLKESTGVQSFYYYAIRLFPFHFQPISIFMESILRLKGDSRKVLQELLALRVYTERHPQDPCPQFLDDALVHPYQPFNNDLIEFPIGTPVTLAEKQGFNLIEIHNEYSYFKVLQQATAEALEHLPLQQQYDEHTIKIIVMDYRLILTLLEVEPELAFECAAVKDHIYQALSWLPICSRLQNFNLELLKVTFAISTYIFKHEPANIVRILTSLELLPQIAIDDVSPEMFNKPYLLVPLTPLITDIDFEFEQTRTYYLLKSYMKLVKDAMKMKIYYTKIQLAGCIYFMAQAFPTFIKELYSNDLERHHIGVDLMQLLYDILSQNSKLLEGSSLIIYNSISSLFITSWFHVKSLFSIFDNGDTRVNLAVISIMDWKGEQLLNIMSSIKRALQCIIYLLNVVKERHFEKHTAFEVYIMETSTINILKNISTYVNHTFDPEIPKIACDVLISFVKIYNVPILYTLALNDSQLQNMFLEHIRDLLDGPKVKIGVIQLVTACVRDQSGMTVGFFNTNPEGRETNCSMLNFIEVYLQNIKNDTNSLMQPLQMAILDLLHELWKYRRQMVIKKITDQENFWEVFVSPLIKPNNVPIETLLQIFEIMILELHYHKNKVDTMINKGLRGIFKNSKHFLTVWFNRVVDITSKIDETSTLDSITADIWRNFILTVRLLHPEYFMREWNKPYLIQMCLEGLLQCFNKLATLNVLRRWSETFLVFKDFPPTLTPSEGKAIFTTATNIVYKITRNYHLLSTDCTTKLLTVISIITTNLKQYLTDNPSFLMQFLTPLEHIFYIEYKMISNKSTKEEKYCENWVLLLNIISNFMELKTAAHESFFIHCRFMERVSEALAFCINSNLPIRIGKFTAMTLINFAKSPFSHHFRVADWYTLSQKMLPPLHYHLQRNRFPNGIIPLFLKEWWTLYLLVVQLNKIILYKNKGFVIGCILGFVYVHQAVLVDALISATAIADPTNLELVVEILRFVCAILEYRNLWLRVDEQTFSQIMITIKEIISASIGVILRPKCLVFVSNIAAPMNIMHIETVVPTASLITITNSYIEIITWACKCMAKCNPTFTKLLNPNDAKPFSLYLEYDFRIPPAINENPKLLTYGSLLCGLHFICKVLNQIYINGKITSTDESTTFVTPVSSNNKEEQYAYVPASQSLSSPVSSMYSVLVMPSRGKEKKESINVLYGFALPEIMGLQAPWLTNLDSDLLMVALNAVATFLASQSLLSVCDVRLERTLKRYVKRELCSEFMLFYNFVGKYISKKYAIFDGQTSSRELQIVHRGAKPPSKPCTSTLLDYDGSLEKYIILDVANACSDKPSNKRTKITDLNDCYLLLLVNWFRRVCRLVYYSKFSQFLSEWHAKSTFVTPHIAFVKNISVSDSDDEDDKR